MTYTTTEKNISKTINKELDFNEDDVGTEFHIPPLRLTRSAATGYSCLNINCNFFSSNPAIEVAIRKNKFVEGTYSYYTPHNNTVWSTICHYCENCQK